jgi:acetyl-CoA C-acetyltransferase
MTEVVLVEGVRTAVGKLGGALKNIQPEHLSAIVMKEVLARSGATAGDLDEVIWGQAKQSSDQPNIARLAALTAGLPIELPAYTVHRQCGSGLQAVMNAMQAIQCGDAKLVLAGGVESMSTAPYYLRSARYGYGAGNGALVDPNTESQPCSQPQDVYGQLTMGMTAENLAEQYNISREEQDAFALESQKRADRAIKEGDFKAEIVPVPVKSRKETVLFSVDEHPRMTTMEALASLKPVFKKGGSVTAGNASGRNDGASGLLVASADKAKALGLKSRARLVSQASAGVSPEIMGIGPAPAIRKALEKAGLTLDDIGLIELNEAFAAQSLAVIKELNLENRMDMINVNGGAIALGHPIGNSGARILVTLLHVMEKRQVRYGVATLCIAGGLGVAVVVELL